MTDIVFRRIRGRIIPIKKKKDSNAADPVKGSAKIVTGSVIGAIGSKSSAKSLRESFNLFKNAAEMRGASRLAAKGSETANKFIRLAAKSKLSGIKARNISKTKFGLAVAVSSGIISSGVSDFFKKDSDVRDEVSGAVGTAASVAVVALTAKKFKIKASNLSELFTGFSKRGSMLSMKKINKIAKTAYKGKRPKPGTQMKFDI